MGNDLDPGMTLLTQLIARRGRSNIALWGFLLLCGLAAVGYWATAVPREAWVDRDTTLYRVIGAVGAVLAFASGRRLMTAIRDAFSPTAHPIYRGVADGKLKMLQRDTGTMPSMAFDFGDSFEMIDAKRDECASIVSYVRQRFPHVPVQEVAIIMKRI